MFKLTSLNEKHAGIALIQVLLITAIFSILLLTTLAITKQNFEHVQKTQDAIAERTLLYSTLQEITLALLTEEWFGPNSGQEQYGWNFYDQPFLWQSQHYNTKQSEVAANVIWASIQDVSGLLDIRVPDENLARFLQSTNETAADMPHLMANLKQAQTVQWHRASSQASKWPGLNFAHKNELQALAGWSDLAKRHSHLFTAQAQMFNPANAPNEILATLLPQALFDIIRQLRADNAIGMHRFSELTGIFPGEGLSFFPGQSLIITVKGSRQVLKAHIKLDANAPQPVKIVELKQAATVAH